MSALVLSMKDEVRVLVEKGGALRKPRPAEECGVRLSGSVRVPDREIKWDQFPSGLVFSRAFSYTELRRRVTGCSQRCISLGENFGGREKQELREFRKVADRPREAGVGGGQRSEGS